MKAPPEIEESLRALRCSCGKSADTIHLVHPSFVGVKPWAAGEDGPNTYPKGDRSVGIACCADHTVEGYWFEVDQAVSEWDDWMRPLHEKAWHGDMALQGLVLGI